MNQMVEVSTESVADLLRQVPFLSPLTAEQREALAAEATLRDYAPETYIIHEGAQGQSFYIVKSGRVLIYKWLHGEPVELTRYGPGAFFGEMALIEDTVRSASVRAETPVEVLEITRVGFKRLLSRNPDVAFAVMREMSERLRQTDHRLVEYLLNKNEELLEAQDKLRRSYESMLIALSNALDLRDTETEGHSVRVAKIAVRIGRELNLSEEALEALWHGAVLHDLGKIGVPDDILHKPGALTSEEWETMEQHPDWGAGIIEEVEFLADAVPVVLYHHEAWDGSGYPCGLRGEDIPLLARIFMIADTYDAITSYRPYQPSRSPEEALAIIREEAGRRFDPSIVAIFEKIFPEICDSI